MGLEERGIGRHRAAENIGGIERGSPRVIINLGIRFPKKWVGFPSLSFWEVLLEWHIGARSGLMDTCDSYIDYKAGDCIFLHDELLRAQWSAQERIQVKAIQSQSQIIQVKASLIKKIHRMEWLARCVTKWYECGQFVLARYLWRRGRSFLF